MTQARTHTLLQSDVAVGTWTLDPARATVRITHKTLWGLMTVKGTFSDVHGGGEIAPDRSVTGTITVGAASVDTKNTKRDTHLRSAEFFDVDAHPSFVVTVHSVSAAGEHLQLAGELVVKDIREPITLTAEITDLGSDTIAVHVTGAVDRQRYGLSFNQLGMIKGLTGLDIDAVFTRDAT
jgi:polyisoprenoid-binding protein YceI